jgi:hypothetical protein
MMKKSLAISLFLLSNTSAKRDWAARHVGLLEKEFVKDCEGDGTPHGYYGAFLEPCEFSFFQESFDSNEPCQGELIGSRIPVNWVFNLTEHYKNKDWDSIDWDSMSSDDIPDPEDLLLWPDQCVGVVPRCYAVTDMEPILSKLFLDGIPDEATHVRVDCTVDALALSRVFYALADDFENAMPTLILWVTSVVVIFIVSTMWCCYGCFNIVHKMMRPEPIVFPARDGVNYVTIEMPNENTKLVK